jgi:hypothetical protein
MLILFFKNSYVVMMTFFSWYPSPHPAKALDAIEVVSVGIITSAQPLQGDVLQLIQLQ